MCWWYLSIMAGSEWSICVQSVLYLPFLCCHLKSGLCYFATDVFLVMGFTGVASKAAHECGCHLHSALLAVSKKRTGQSSLICQWKKSGKLLKQVCVCILCLNLIDHIGSDFCGKVHRSSTIRLRAKWQLCLGTGLLIWHLPMAQTISNPKSLGRWWWFCGASFPKIHKKSGYHRFKSTGKSLSNYGMTFLCFGGPLFTKKLVSLC